MNGSLYDRRREDSPLSIPLHSTKPPHLSSHKVGEHNVDELRSREPKSPFFRAFDKSWASRPVSTLHRSLSLRIILHILGRALYTLIPSFIEVRLRREPPKPEKIYPTAYLDGMRGLAAFAVCICHLSYQTFWITFGFGQGEPGENSWPIQLPIIKLFYSGPPMVAIFFVISGYALSYKPLKQMRARQYDGLLATMSSSVLRRGIRLFLPCFASTFLVGLLAQCNLFVVTQPFSANKELMRAHYEDHAWTAPNPWVQFKDWAWKMFDFVHPWDWFIFGGSVDLDRHLWTIPVEFRASMVLFLTQIMVARMRSYIRMATLVALIVWGLHWDRWEMFLFWSGAILAELDQIALASKSDPVSGQQQHVELSLDPDTPPKSPSFARYRPAARRLRTSPKLKFYFWWSSFIFALFLASYPDDAAETTPGYRLLSKMIPPYYSERYRFWQSIAAVQLVWTVNNADFLKAIFNHSAIQYLGKVSYALYLMHGPVIHTWGYIVMPFMWSLTGSEPRFNFELGFFLSACLIIPGIIWAADVFWRVVDVNCVKFARWVENHLIVAA